MLLQVTHVGPGAAINIGSTVDFDAEYGGPLTFMSANPPPGMGCACASPGRPGSRCRSTAWDGVFGQLVYSDMAGHTSMTHFTVEMGRGQRNVVVAETELARRADASVVSGSASRDPNAWYSA